MCGGSIQLKLRAKLQAIFFKLGCFSQRFSWAVLGIGFFIFIGLSVGIITASIETDVEKLWMEGKVIGRQVLYLHHVLNDRFMYKTYIQYFESRSDLILEIWQQDFRLKYLLFLLLANAVYRSQIGAVLIDKDHDRRPCILVDNVTVQMICSQYKVNHSIIQLRISPSFWNRFDDSVAKINLLISS